MESIGKYELQEFLGGGMSHVYRARDTVIGRTVAVKVLTQAGCEDHEVKERFLAEARMAGNISHDHVMHVYDFGVDEQQRPFMVMEFLRGEDLRHAMQNGHIGDLKNRLHIALDVARALEYIHTLKIIHRDIKPENIHISDTGVVKLMDFGIAKAEGMTLTRAGYVLGTPYYMAPEQVMGREITPQVDVYAFAMMLCEMLTGAKPISGDTMERIFYAILNEPVNLEPVRQAGVPESVCTLLEHCTAKRPEDRPAGMTAVCAELERILEQLDAPTVLLPPAQTAPPRHPAEAPAVPAVPSETEQPAAASGRPVWLWPAAIFAVLVLGAGIFLATRPHQAAPPKPTAAQAAVVTPQVPAGMVLVPAGNFLSGENRTPAYLPAFFIDRTTVTNQDYQAFCAATNHPLPDSFPKDHPELPVVNVTILDAQAYAKWADKRLPTPREWEKAARGTDGRLFPWGNEKDLTRANVGTKQLRPADDFPTGASPYGALQMVGNVWQYVDQLTTPGPVALQFYATVLTPKPTASDPWYQIRGLSMGAGETLENGAIYDSFSAPARWKSDIIGFRCARDAQ
jgi:eukaryotic-like serine/threonine-protein kinase